MRHATILACGKVETKLLAIHRGKAHKIANVPGSPHIFYSCGDDGVVLHVSNDLRVLAYIFIYLLIPFYLFIYFLTKFILLFFFSLI